MIDSCPTRPAPERRTVAVMGTCYALGTFADNFYKQAAVLMAAAAQMTDVQSMATVLFSLPFVLFSAPAGWLADRVAKKHIVVAAKTLELIAMAAGGILLIRANWTGILIVMFLMASQSTLFSPAINGSIPENFPPEQVPRVNSLIKLASTAAILAGMALAGVFLDLGPASLYGLLPDLPLKEDAYGRGMAALFLLALSCAGLVTALLMRHKPPSSVAGLATGMAPFPWTGPLDSLRHALDCRKDKPLFLVLLADSWFYGISVVAVISIANLALSLGYSNTVAGLMAAVLMVGVALGALFAGRHSAESWRRLLVPSGCGIGLALLLVSLAPLVPQAPHLQLGWIFASLFLCGLCGGIYLIPLESAIQVRPRASEKGKIIAVSNFMSFTAMALFGTLFQPVSLLPPALTFVVFGLSTLAFVLLFAARRLPGLEGGSLGDAAASPLALLLQAILSLRYTVREEGLDVLPAPRTDGSTRPGILFLPNHPALIDPFLVYSRLAGLRPRPLADQGQMSGFLQRLAGRITGTVTIPDLGPEQSRVPGANQDRRDAARAVRLAIDAVIQALQRGENVLLYPSGRAYRTGRESLGTNSAAARVLQAVPGARVVLVRTTGLWGSEFSYASGRKPNVVRSLLRGLLTVLANGVFFTPRRKVRMVFAEPADLASPAARARDKASLNACLEEFYNQDGEEEPVRIVPRYFWQRRKREREL